MMNLHDAVAILDGLGSCQDPIWYKGEQTTVDRLVVGLDRACPAELTRISYWGEKDGKVRLIKNGTVTGMIADRQRLKKEESRRWS